MDLPPELLHPRMEFPCVATVWSSTLGRPSERSWVLCSQLQLVLQMACPGTDGATVATLLRVRAHKNLVHADVKQHTPVPTNHCDRAFPS